MDKWIPLFQTLAWPIFIGILIWIFYKQIGKLLLIMIEKLKGAQSVEITKEGVKLSNFPTTDRIVDDSALYTSDERIVEETKNAISIARPQFNSLEDAPDYYLRHSAKPDPKLVKNNLQYYQISFWLDADDPSILDNVEKVIYILHPTFLNPIREIKNRASSFKVNTKAWGEFNLKAMLYLKGDPNPISLGRFIDF